MTYISKIEQAHALINKHNEQIEDPNAIKINWENIEKNLRNLGATSEDALKECKYEDLEECGVPKLLARQIARIFREDEKGELPTHVGKRKASRMTYNELFAYYDPEEENEISKKLKELSKNAKIIVFTQEGSVDVEKSVELLNEIKKGFPERNGGIYVGKEGDIRRIYKVGEKPNNFLEEDPLYPGRALRPGGISDQTNRSWAGIEKRVKQLLYLAVKETKELNPSIKEAHDLMDMALREDAVSYLKTRYPRTAVSFEEKKEQNELPKLQVELQKARNRCSNDPFFATED